MKPGVKALIPVFIVVLLVIAQDALFITYENEQAVITEFGKFVRTIVEPGLNMKKPFVQDVILYDKRLLDHDIPATEIVTKDKRTLVVDNFAKWRISDPELFFTRARTEKVAKDRLRDIIYSELRQDFGGHDLSEIVTTHRVSLMKLVTERSNAKVNELDMGIDIVDVRIKRADLPPENQVAVFRRMSEERKRIAKQWRSEGSEEAQKIRANTAREKAIILSEAEMQEKRIRGEADGEATRITAEAYNEDPEFYEFVRSLEAYGIAMKSKATLVISKDTPFLKYLK